MKILLIFKIIYYIITKKDQKIGVFKMYFTYILRCNDGTLYCGYTTDLDKRLKTHNKGEGAKYTKSRLPVELVYFEELETKSLAMKRECQIKKLTRGEKLKLINKNENGTQHDVS